MAKTTKSGWKPREKHLQVREPTFIKAWLGFPKATQDDRSKLILAFLNAFPQLKEATIVAKMTQAHKNYDGLPGIPGKDGYSSSQLVADHPGLKRKKRK
jgi:hypothetical protein